MNLVVSDGEEDALVLLDGEEVRVDLPCACAIQVWGFGLGLSGYGPGV